MYLDPVRKVKGKINHIEEFYNNCKATFSAEPTVGRCRRNSPRYTNDRIWEWETHQAPDYLPLAHTIPRSLGPGLVPVSPPASPPPLYYHRQALSSSHHGRRTAVRELLLFVGRRPAQAAGFSMISNPFWRAYARNHPEPIALKQNPRVGRLTEF